jgi:hypothetical protein
MACYSLRIPRFLIIKSVEAEFFSITILLWKREKLAKYSSRFRASPAFSDLSKTKL